MQYNVAQLLKEPIGSTRIYQLEVDFIGPQPLADRASGPIHMLRTHHGILVRAPVDVESTFTCVRCLVEFSGALNLPIEEEFFPTVDPNTGRDRPAPEEVEEDSLIDANHTLDLTGVINGYIFTAMPMKPLCYHDCKGLCQICGTNQNKQNCDCPTQAPDTRWRALMGFTPE
jgi:uncharacterized protein